MPERKRFFFIEAFPYSLYRETSELAHCGGFCCFRRNRIRTTEGLQSVPSLQKLYMSNNEIQGLGSLVKLESLVRLQTLQMEGNPVWSNPDYSSHLVSCLPSLSTLDQQDVTPEMKGSAKR